MPAPRRARCKQERTASRRHTCQSTLSHSKRRPREMPPLSASLMEQNGIRPPRVPKSVPLRRSLSSLPYDDRQKSLQQNEDQQRYRHHEQRFSTGRPPALRRALSLTQPPPADSGHLEAYQDHNGVLHKSDQTEMKDESDGEEQEEQAEEEVMEKPGIAQEGQGWTAEEIASRRFVALVCQGPGLPVLKHNRGRGTVRRVLKFNIQRNCLTWHGVLPPYSKTSVPSNELQKVTRSGQFVVLSINNQGDVGFKCTKLTDAIVLQIGLGRLIRDDEAFAS